MSKVPLIGATFLRGCETCADSGASCTITTLESGCLKVQPKVGDKLHLRLNIDVNSIANKYCEGKLQRTLKREFKRT